MNTLEVLYAAEARLENKRTKFVFSDWPSCTCGHIYAASNGGRKARGRKAVSQEPSGLHADTLRAVCRVLGLRLKDYPDLDRFAVAVSDYTFKMRQADDAAIRVGREHALTVIKQAIAALEAEQERNRLDVLAQTKDIIDNAPVEVVR